MRPKTIGVVIPELNNTFCAEIITGMEDILQKSWLCHNRL